MLERFIGFLNKEKEKFKGPNIRLHHLSDWNDLVSYYHKHFDKNIWDYRGSELKKAREAIERRSKRESLALVAAQTWFKNTNFPVEKELYKQKQLKYLNDALGTSPDVNKRVVDAWASSQLQIVDLIAKDKDTMILINDTKDGICNGCAVGWHCNKNIFSGYYFDGNEAYQIVMLSLLKNDFWKNRGRFEIRPNKDIFISGELLFDKDFLPLVEKTVLDRYPKLFADRSISFESNIK